MHYLSEKLWFPSIEQAFPVNGPKNEFAEEGLLAIGGDLSMERLLLAYNSGIFPWYEEGQPLLWWSPDPRMVLFPEKFKVSKSLRRTIKNGIFSVTFNQNFSEVIKSCATVRRKGDAGTWITQEMQQAYIAMHKAGHAVSVEVWKEGTLVGGLYGIDLPNKKVFCGESMFSLVSDASKVAFYHLSEYAKTNNYKLIDCQIYNEHLESLGAEEITRNDFLSKLKS